MATVINVNEDFSTPIEVIGADDILNIGKNVIGDVLETAIVAGNVADGRQFNIRGRVIARDDHAILLGSNLDPSGSSGGSINISSTGSLRADAGSAILAFISDLEINNSGTLRGGMGISGSLFNSTVVNKGEIRTEGYCFFASSGSVTLRNSGLLDSEVTQAVYLNGGGNDFLNSGVVRGSEFDEAVRFNSGVGDFNIMRVTGKVLSGEIAILGGAGNESVYIDGLVRGDINLGDGFDTFSCRRGKVDGVVIGGAGDDFYELFGSKVKLQESDGGGVDTLSRIGNAILQDFFENLRLGGSGDFDGRGNGLGNSLFGNRGDNVLKGLGGNDLFSGGRGNDTFFGGADIDTFQMFSDSGNDKLMDFTPGEDVVDLNSFSFSSFDQIQQRLFNTKSGVEFRQGGCELLFRNLEKSDLTIADFDF